MLRKVLQCISYSLPFLLRKKKKSHSLYDVVKVGGERPNDGFIMSSALSTLLKHSCRNPHRMVAPRGEDVPLEYHGRNWQAGPTFQHPARRRAPSEHLGVTGPGIRLFTGAVYRMSSNQDRSTGVPGLVGHMARQSRAVGSWRLALPWYQWNRGCKTWTLQQKAAKKMKELEHLLWGKAWTGEEKAPGRSFQFIQAPEEKVQTRYWALFGNAQWQLKRHKLKHKRPTLNIRKHCYFVWWYLNTGKGFSERSWVSHLGDIQMPFEHDIRWPYLNWMASHSNHEVQFNLNHSMILWFINYCFLVFFLFFSWTYFYFSQSNGEK